MGGVAIAIGAIVAALKLYDVAVVSFDESIENATNAKQAYENTQDEISRINTELETTRARIDEINSKDHLSFTDQQELSNLERQNGLLEQELEYQQLLAEMQQEQAVAAAEDVLTNKGFAAYKDGTTEKRAWWRDLLDFGNTSVEKVDVIEYVEREQKRLDSLNQQYGDLLNDRQKLVEQYGLDSPLVEMVDNQIDLVKQNMVEAQGNIADNWQTILSYQDQIADPDLLQRIRQLNADITGIPLDLKDTSYWDKYYGGATEAAATAESAAEESAQAIKQSFGSIFEGEDNKLSEDIDNYISSVSKLQSAMDSLSGGTLGLEDVIGLVEEFPQLADYVDFTSDSFGDLDKGIRRLMQDSPDALVSQLRELAESGSLTEDAAAQVNNLADALEDIPTAAIKDASGEFGVLADSINSAKRARDELAQSLQEEDYDAGYDARQDYFGQMSELLGAGEVGSKALSSIKEYFGLAGQSAEATQAWADANLKFFGTIEDGKFKAYEDAADGVVEWLDAIEQMNRNGQLDPKIASWDSETGDFHYSINHLKELADAFGWTEEMVQDFVQKYRMYVDEVDWMSRDMWDNWEEFNNQKLIFDVDGSTYANLQQLMDYTGLTADEVTNLIGVMNDWRAQNSLEPIQIIGADQVTITQGMVDAMLDAGMAADDLISTLAELSSQGNVEIEADVKVGDTDLNAAIAEKTGNVDAETTVSVTVTLDDEQFTIDVTGDKQLLDETFGEGSSWDAVVNGDTADAETKAQTVMDTMDDITAKGCTATVTDNSSGARSGLSTVLSLLRSVSANSYKTVTVEYKTIGTPPKANATGTRHAKAGLSLLGDEYSPNGAPKPELVVSGDEAYLAGVNGPVMGYLNEGDVVYTADETKRILKGNSFSNRIPAFAGGRSTFLKKKSTGGSSGGSSSGSSGGSSSYSTSYTGGSGSGSASEEAKEFSEDLDWIEVLIDRVERKIKNLATVASSSFKKLSKRSSALHSEMAAVSDEIEYQKQAYQRYMQEASSVDLPESYKELVRSGKIDLETITDEDLKDKIDQFRSLYEKALDARGAVKQLHEDLAQLYKDNFDNIEQSFEHKIEKSEHMVKTYEDGIDQLEAHGYMVSTKYYSAIQRTQRKQLGILNQELEDLTSALEEGMKSGEIQKYSDTWYEMQESIHSVEEEIGGLNTSLAETAKTMREIKWGYFDYAQERISKLTDEADFLIELMSSDKLFNDDGSMTSQGLATAAMHGQNYDVYMAQADMYKKEMKKVTKQLAKDPNNTDIIARREELLELQRKSVLAAEDEKKAMVSLVKDGIELQLSSLKDLIDTYNESLSSAKSLHDYQKKIADQTKTVTSIQKQLSAYEGDDSEENRLRVQQLKDKLNSAQEDLQEAQYDRYISDQRDLLDNLYTDYEANLNSRLDNVDDLMKNMIKVINANATSVDHSADKAASKIGVDLTGVKKGIRSTLKSEAKSVGVTLTDEMRSIWGGGSKTLAQYGTNFTDKLVSINDILSDISATVSQMVKASDAATKSSDRTEKQKMGVAIARIMGIGDWGSGTAASRNLAEKGFNPGEINSLIAKISSGALGPIASILKKYGIKNLSRYSYGRFASGGLVDYTGPAWVDGSPTRPEAFLSAKDTKNVQDLLSMLRSTVGNVSPVIANPKSMSAFAGVSGAGITSGTTTFGDMQINNYIENVEDLDDLMSQMRNSKEFGRLVRAMSTDLINGGNSLARFKH